jgi:hypothetical protein
MRKDPLGCQPAPVTGRRTPDRSDMGARRGASRARRILEELWLQHAPQQAIIDELVRYRDDTLGRRGRPLTGRRLSEHSQAGKSATMARVKHELALDRENEGRPPNAHQVIIVELDRRSTVKQLFQEILKALGDEYWAQPVSAKLLEDRITDFVRRLDVELLIVDEVQHLRRKADDAGEVTDKLKVFLDRGVVPLVLVGDEDSVEFFRENRKLAARLGERLQLLPLDPEGSARDARLFKRFCAALDEALVANNIFGRSSELTTPATLDLLLRVSGGHVGRVARLIQLAAPAAVWRGAGQVEAFDLSRAVRGYAMENGWVDHDPFASRK